MKTLPEELEKPISWRKLPQKYQRLLAAAKKAMTRAYCPYSKFQMGAAVLTDSGKIISGCNYEVAASTVSVCAERVVIVTANALGYGKELRAIATIGRGRDSPTRKVTPPCGSCLQMLSEAAQRADYDLGVILSTTHCDAILVTRISKLLPFPFSGLRNLLESEAQTLANAN